MKGNRKGAFTLLEIMLAVAVLAMVGVSIHRIVEGTLSAVRHSGEAISQERLHTAFADFLRFQMQNLPQRTGAITGEPHRFDNLSGDEMRWIAYPGAAMLTRFATGEYQVALTTRRVGERLELGLNRQHLDGVEAATWFPLLPEVHALEIRYFDPRSQSWMERWSDQANRPALVRVRLWMTKEGEPYETLHSIPYASEMAQNPSARFTQEQRQRQRIEERLRQREQNRRRNHPSNPGGGTPPRPPTPPAP